LNKAPDGSSTGLSAERIFSAAPLLQPESVPAAALVELGAPSVAAASGSANEALAIAVMSSYVVDWKWLATLLPPSLGDCTIAVNWLPETRDSENPICRFGVGSRIVALRDGTEGTPGRQIRVVHAAQGKGLMHAKMGVLRFTTFARVFVTTANFTLDDWVNMGQGTWAHDFPIANDDDAAAAAPDVTADSFTGDLWRALAILGLDAFAGSALRGVDLSTATARLVLSAPHATVMGALVLHQRQPDADACSGASDDSDDDSNPVQRGVDVETAEDLASDTARAAYRGLSGCRNGIGSLRRAVRAARAACQHEISRPLPSPMLVGDASTAPKTLAAPSLNWNVGLATFQASSIGGITDDVLREIESAVGAPAVHALFPSVNSVQAQLDAGHVGAITLRCFQMGQSTLMRQRWHDLTTLLPFHSKLMWHEVPASSASVPGTVAGWLFVGSHNLTSDSWCFTRRIPASSGGGAFDSDPRNIEIGVVVPYVRPSVIGSVLPTEFGVPAAVAAPAAGPNPFVFLRHRAMVMEAGERSGMVHADASDAALYHWSKFVDEYSNPFGRH
jgi:hypothetical protein